MSNHSNGHRLRMGRYSGVGQMYLVTATTLNRAPIFADWVLGRMLVSHMKSAQDDELARFLAWVIMPDHVHWLFELRGGSLPKLMQRLKSRSAIEINQARGGKGRVWQDGYHDKAVRREDDLIHFARYIIANPVRAGLVETVRQYPLWDAIWV